MRDVRILTLAPLLVRIVAGMVRVPVGMVIVTAVVMLHVRMR